MIFNKNEIFSLWIKNPPSPMNYLTWKSWIDCGYKVVIFSDDLKLFEQVPKYILQRITISPIPYLSSLPSFTITKENLLQFVDLWRFIYLYQCGGTWIDSDLMLRKRLPSDNIIISSEHTLKSGGRKSKSDFTPNIGVLRFPPHHPFVNAVIEAMKPTTKADLNHNVNNTSKMKKFINEIKKKKWGHIFDKVVEPHIFCPVPYPFAKEIFTSHYENTKIKYGLNFNYTDESTIGLHLWENLVLNKYKVNPNQRHEECIFNKWNLLKKPLSVMKECSGDSSTTADLDSPVV